MDQQTPTSIPQDRDTPEESSVEPAESQPQPLSAVNNPQQPDAATAAVTVMTAADSPEVTLAPQLERIPEQRSEIVYGHNEDTAASPHHSNKRLLFVIAGLFVLATAVIFFYVLPGTWSQAYMKRMQPAYQTQSAQLQTVYASLDRPIFTSNNSSAESDKQDAAYIKGVLQTAEDNTAVLEAKNRLIVLPGTVWVPSVSQANRQYQAMKQYVSDSQTYLRDYTVLLAYAQQFSAISRVQLPLVLKDFAAIGAAAHNKAALLSAMQAANTTLQSFAGQVKSLKPSADMQRFNSSLLVDLIGMNRGLQGLQSAEQGIANADTAGSFGEFQTASKNFNDLLKINPAANLLKRSIILNQITTLEKERPLQ